MATWTAPLVVGGEVPRKWHSGTAKVMGLAAMAGSLIMGSVLYMASELQRLQAETALLHADSVGAVPTQLFSTDVTNLVKEVEKLQRQVQTFQVTVDTKADRATVTIVEDTLSTKASLTEVYQNNELILTLQHELDLKASLTETTRLQNVKADKTSQVSLRETLYDMLRDMNASFMFKLRDVQSSETQNGDLLKGSVERSRRQDWASLQQINSSLYERVKRTRDIDSTAVDRLGSTINSQIQQEHNTFEHNIHTVNDNLAQQAQNANRMKAGLSDSLRNAVATEQSDHARSVAANQLTANQALSSLQRVNRSLLERVKQVQQSDARSSIETRSVLSAVNSTLIDKLLRIRDHAAAWDRQTLNEAMSSVSKVNDSLAWAVKTHEDQGKARLSSVNTAFSIQLQAQHEDQVASDRKTLSDALNALRNVNRSLTVGLSRNGQSDVEAAAKAHLALILQDETLRQQIAELRNEAFTRNSRTWNLTKIALTRVDSRVDSASGVDADALARLNRTLTSRIVLNREESVSSDDKINRDAKASLDSVNQDLTNMLHLTQQQDAAAVASLRLEHDLKIQQVNNSLSNEMGQTRSDLSSKSEHNRHKLQTQVDSLKDWVHLKEGGSSGWPR